MIRILVADDHAVVRQGICSLIDMTPDMELIAEAADGEQVLSAIQNEDVSLLIVDMNMPGINGIELIGKVRDTRPDLPVLVFTMLTESQVAEAA